jgi:hypothetical protein
MYARVASFDQRDADVVDDLIGSVRERVSSGQAPPGAKSLLMLVDRAGGKSLGISFFESEDAIREAEPAFERMGDEIPEQVRGRRTSVEVYEVALDEAGEGAKAARVSSFEGPADKIDEGTRYAEENVLPRARQMKGWKGVVSLVDRKSGRSRLITLWESEEALRASEEQADQLRKQAAEGAGERISAVERYEVAVALRVGASV